MRRVLPILFNTEMVRAILDGRKSCTRRIVKPQPQSRLCYTFAGCNCGTWGYPSKTAYENWGDEYKLPEDITDEELKEGGIHHITLMISFMSEKHGVLEHGIY